MLTYKLQRGKDSYTLLVGVLIVLTTLVCSTPILAESEFMLPSFLLGVTLLLFQSDSLALRKNSDVIFSNLLYIGLVIFYRVFGISSALWSQLFQHLTFFFLAMFMLLIPVWRKGSGLRWAFVLSTLIILFNLADNIYLSIKYPLLNISRQYVEDMVPDGINAGSSNFYIFILFFFIIFFFLFLNRRKESGKRRILVSYRGRLHLLKKKTSQKGGSANWAAPVALLFVSCLVSGAYICGFCNKASVVLFFFLSIVLLILAKRHNSGSFFFIYGGLAGLLALLIVLIFKDPLIELILAISPSERLSGRLILLLDSDNVNASESSFSARQDLWMVSLKTWTSSFQNFLFGIGDHRAVIHPEQTGIGQHGDIEDSLARYGLVGCIILFNAVIKSCRYIISLFPKRCKMQLISVFFILFLCGVSKKIFLPEVGCALFILLPFASCFIEEKTPTVSCGGEQLGVGHKHN